MNYRHKAAVAAAITSLSLLLCFSGCATPPVPTRPTGNIITGTIYAGSLVLFPPQSMVEIVLQDMNNSEQDNEAELIEIAKQKIRNPQVNPIKFSLRYDPEDIVNFRAYNVLVQVYDNEENLQYYTPYGIPVITFGNPDTIEVYLSAYPN